MLHSINNIDNNIITKKENIIVKLGNFISIDEPGAFSNLFLIILNIVEESGRHFGWWITVNQWYPTGRAEGSRVGMRHIHPTDHCDCCGGGIYDTFQSTELMLRCRLRLLRRRLRVLLLDTLR